MVTLKDVSDFFKSFDLFGETFTFKSRKRKRYNSLMGGVTSFIFIIYTLYYVMFHFSDLLNKNSRKTEISQNFKEYNTVDLIEHKDFIFFICLRGKNMKSDFFLSDNLKIEGNFIDEKNNNNTNFNISKINLNIDSCDKNNYLNIIPTYFDKKDFENCKCLNATNLNEKNNIIKLRTDKTWANKAYLNIKILPNNNSNNNTDTNNEAEKIQNYFQDNESKLFLHFPSYYVDKKSIEEPVKKNIISESFELNLNTRVHSKLEFSRIDFNEFTSLYDEGNFNYNLI
jgi:hypothetical protein